MGFSKKYTLPLNSYSSLLWKRYPALYFALAFLLGIASFFHIYLLAFTFFIPKKQLWIVPFIGILYAKGLAPHVPEGREGTALFHIEEVKYHSGPFHSSLAYSGKIRSFFVDHKTYHRIPCHLYIVPHQKRPLANRDYIIPKAELLEISPYHFVLKSKESWIPLENTHSFAEWRFQTKEKVKQWIRTRYREPRVQDLMSALLTGHLENRVLSYQFGKVGLQHLLAISGFHFALLTLFLAFLLKRFLPEKGMALCLIVLLSLYFFYMGSAPSISRAWMGVLIFLIGIVFSFRPTPLNALGMALLIALTRDPLIVINVGFQLSFGATLGILLFYKSFEEKLQSLLPKRPFLVLKQMSSLDQWGYLLCAYLRKGLALNGAVLTFTAPLLLYHFHSFPLLSLCYNLFFPFLFSLMMGGLMVGFFLPGISPLNELYATFLIDLVANAPKKLMFDLGIYEIVGMVLGITLTGLWVTLTRIRIRSP